MEKRRQQMPARKANEGMKEHRLLAAIIAGAAAGALMGGSFPDLAVKTAILGELFLNALKMMVLPLIVTSLVVGMTQIGDAKHLGAIGLKTFFYYMVTTGIAVAAGIFLVNWIQPGQAAGTLFPASMPEKISAVQEYSFMDVVRGIFHPNLVRAAADLDILPIIFASLLFGSALISLGPKAAGTCALFGTLNDAVMKMVHWIIYFTPVGVFGLIASKLGEAGGAEAFGGLIRQLGGYVFTVIAGLLIHGLIVLPVILLVFARRNPAVYFSAMAKAILTAFGTSSSSATLPLTMDCATGPGKVSERTSSVVLPLGATVNMDGTALYEAVAAIFIAQSYGVDLNGAQQVIIFLTATLAAVGAAGIPEAGLVTMVMVLQSVGLPAEGIGLILAVDWFLDRCRTTVNVWGDAVGAAVIDRWEARTPGGSRD